jgi:hypothetical protein
VSRSTRWLAAALVLLVARPSSTPAQGDPTYSGVPRSEWLKQIRGDDVQTRINAIDAFAAMGMAPEFTAGLFVERLTGDRSAQVRARAAGALGRLGAAAKRAGPALAAAVAGPRGSDPEPAVRLAALQALVRIDPAALKSRDLARAVLADPNSTISCRIVDELSRNPESARALLPDVLRDERLARRYLDGKLLEAAGLADKAMVPNAVVALKHTSPVVRLLALDFLQHVGPGAGPAVPALVATLVDPKRHHHDPGVRALVVEALVRTGPAAKASVPALKAALDGPDPGPRWAARLALAAIDPAAATTTAPCPTAARRRPRPRSGPAPPRVQAGAAPVPRPGGRPADQNGHPSAQNAPSGRKARNGTPRGGCLGSLKSGNRNGCPGRVPSLVWQRSLHRAVDAHQIG